MQEAQFLDELQHDPARGKCLHCNNPEIVEGYATHLCHECRQRYIKYPIPLWIKIFAGGVFLVILFSLFKFPENLSIAIHQQRGKDAERENKFITVRREFEEVLKRSPENMEAKGYLMLASFYNEDYKTFLKYSEELQGVDFGNSNLLARLNDIIDQVPNYYPTEELGEVMDRLNSTNATFPDTALQNFLIQHPENIFALYTYASQLYEVEKYSECDSLLNKLLEKDLIYHPALGLMASSKRQSGDLEGSLEYCRRLLEINRESAYAYANMARTFLKQKKDKEALEMAEKSMSLNDKHPYTIATLALAYHFNNQLQKRDALISKWKSNNDAVAKGYYQYVLDVIDHKEPFRN